MVHNLKPCPFCCSFDVCFEKDGNACKAGCLVCGANTGWVEDSTDCIKAASEVWNKRAYDLNAITIKSCPFCGSKWTQVRYTNNPFDTNHIYGGFRAECTDCYASTTSYQTIQQAVEAWNRRADNE